MVVITGARSVGFGVGGVGAFASELHSRLGLGGFGFVQHRSHSGQRVENRERVSLHSGQMHTHTRAHMHTYSRAHAHLRIHTYTRTHMHAHTRRHTHAHAHSQRPPMIFISRMGPTSMARASITNTRCGSWEGVPERGHRSCRRGERASIRAHAAHAGTRAAAPAPEVSRAAQRRMAMVSGAPSLRNMAACLFAQRASSGGVPLRAACLFGRRASSGNVPLRAACLFGRRASSGMLSRCCTLTTVANGTYLGERHGRVHAAVVLPYQHAIPAHMWHMHTTPS